MSAWGGGDRQLLAESIGVAFARYCRWPTPYFLPGDVLSVVVGGPGFGAVDDTDLREAMGAIEEIAGVRMEAGFWDACGSGTLGELVDRLLAAAGPDSSIKPNPPQGFA